MNTNQHTHNQNDDSYCFKSKRLGLEGSSVKCLPCSYGHLSVNHSTHVYLGGHLPGKGIWKRPLGWT